MEIEKIIDRFDEEAFETILGRVIVATLAKLKLDSGYAERLNKILWNTFSGYELLEKSVARNLVLDVLNKEEALELAKRLGLENSVNLYAQLKKVEFKGKTKTTILEFFDIQIPPKLERKSIQYEGYIEPKYGLFEHQIDVLTEVEKYLKSERNRVLIHMPTGSGKTRTSITFACHHLLDENSKSVVWFAHTKELLDQAFSEFEKAWSYLGNRKIKYLKFWGGGDFDLENTRNSFIVVGLDKAYSSLMKDVATMKVFADNCSLVILDEAHMAIAPTYKLLLNLFTSNSASLIGLSATPGRTWNDREEDKKLADFFHRQKATLQIDGYPNPVDFLTEMRYLAKVTYTPLLYDGGVKLGPIDLKYLSDYYLLPNQVLKTVSEDVLRNLLIISKVQELVKTHQRIILFSISKYHAILLNSLLVAMEIKSSVVTSDTNPFDREGTIIDFKTSIADSPTPHVLCNFGILTTGLDAPETSCAVITRPTDSLVLYSQMVGRAIRGPLAGGNEHAEIITVVDVTLPGFREVSEAFVNWNDVWD